MARTATLANVAASASSVVLMSGTGGAAGRAVYNDSVATLYLKYGETASTTSHTVQIPAGGHYEFPHPVYDGVVHGIWSSATGSARVTEVA